MNPADSGDSAHREPGTGHVPGPDFSLASLLRWIGDHARSFHGAVGLFLTLGLLFSAGALLLFIGVAALIARGATQRFDTSILLWMDSHSNPQLDTAALEITSLGSAYVTSVVVVIASTFLWQTRHRYSAALLWVALAGGWFLNWMLKSLFARPRPELFEWRVPYAGMSSYPSGHAMSAMIFYTTLAYLVIRLEPTRALRRLTLLVFAIVILMVGMSRVYLGVHYPSDVIGGYLVGFAWASVCALGIEAIRFFRERRPELADEERDLDRGVIAERPGPADYREGSAASGSSRREV
jgi:membrane-associated phospholipid phosphatase